MLLSSLPKPLADNVWKVVLLPLGAYLSFKVVVGFVQGMKNRRKAKALGCLPCAKVNNYDPILGLDALWKAYKDLTAGTALEKTRTELLKYNNTASNFVLGRNVISTTEPQNVKAILATKFKDFELGEDRHQAIAPVLGEGIFTNNGEAWKHSREMLRPAFERARIDDSAMLDTHASSLIANIPTDGTSIDLFPLFYSFSLDSATHFLFGKSTCTLERKIRGETTKGDAEAFAEAFGSVFDIYDPTKTFWGVLAIFFPKLVTPSKQHVNALNKFVDTTVANAISDKKHSAPFEEKDSTNSRTKQPYVFLDQLLLSTTNPVKIRAELLNTLLAGRDTTASTLLNVFHTLSQHPEIYAKLSDEILSSFPDNETPHFGDLKSLSYLRALINESLRLYPIVPENLRSCREDTTLPTGGGPDAKSPVFVPKGYEVHWSLWSMHRRHDLYGDDADEFRPERWIDGDAQKVKGYGRNGDGGKGLRVGWEYVPFNGGPRVCIGQQFALMEIMFVIVRFVQSFKTIEPVEEQKGRKWNENWTLLGKVDGGVKVVATARD